MLVIGKLDMCLTIIIKPISRKIEYMMVAIFAEIFAHFYNLTSGFLFKNSEGLLHFSIRLFIANKL